MKNNNGKRYTEDMKESIIKRMMPPNNESVSQLSKEFGISEPTLYNWRKKARVAGNPNLEMDRVRNIGVVKTSSLS